MAYFGNSHINHEFFWESLAPKSDCGGEFPYLLSDFGMSIQKYFGSPENLIIKMTSKCGDTTGMWSALVYNKKTDSLEIKTDLKLSMQGESDDLIPLLSTDIWVEASNLFYQEFRPEFVDDMWKIVNWDKIEDRF